MVENEHKQPKKDEMKTWDDNKKKRSMEKS